MCDYGYDNVVQEPIYHTGDPCSECKSGCSSEYDSLCDVSEDVDPRAEIEIAAYGPRQ